MKNKCLILDYGMGNIKSIEAACHYNKIETITSNKKEDIEKCGAIILPGVGSFKAGMQNLKNINLIDLLNNEIIVKKKCFLEFV